MPTYAKRINPKQRPPRPEAPADSMPIFRSKKKIKKPSPTELQDMERQEQIRRNRFTIA